MRLSGLERATCGTEESAGSARSANVVVPEPSSDDAVLFWAERDRLLAMGGWAIVAGIMLPFAFFYPVGVIVGAFLSLALTLLNVAAFKLELTHDMLRLRTGFLGRTHLWRLDDLCAVEVRDTAMEPVYWGRIVPVGHLILRTAGQEIAIPGIKDPVRAAEAIVLLQSGGDSPCP